MPRSMTWPFWCRRGEWHRWHNAHDRLGGDVISDLAPRPATGHSPQHGDVSCIRQNPQRGAHQRHFGGTPHPRDIACKVQTAH